jgi:hypothetical protein
MTADGGTNPEMPWDEARLALGRVAELFMQEADTTEIPHDELVAQLHDLPNYELIPESVRDTIEDLNYSDRRLLTGTFTTLAKNHFYLENNLGILAAY